MGLGAAIADFNDAHGITGVQIGSRTWTNEQLRELELREGYGYEEAWMASREGLRFRRPRGRMIYVPRRLDYVWLGWRTVTRVLCDREVDGAIVADRYAELSMGDIDKMEVVG